MAINNHFPKKDKISDDEKKFTNYLVAGQAKGEAAAMVWPELKNPAVKATTVLKKQSVQEEILSELEKAKITKQDTLAELKHCLTQDEDDRIKLDAAKQIFDLVGWKRNKIDINLNDGTDLDDRLSGIAQWALSAYIVEGLTERMFKRVEEGRLQFSMYAKMVNNAAKRNQIQFPQQLQGDMDGLSLETCTDIMAKRASFLRMLDVDLDKEFEIIDAEYEIKE